MDDRKFRQHMTRKIEDLQEAGTINATVAFLVESAIYEAVVQSSATVPEIGKQAKSRMASIVRARRDDPALEADLAMLVTDVRDHFVEDRRDTLIRFVTYVEAIVAADVAPSALHDMIEHFLES